MRKTYTVNIRKQFRESFMARAKLAMKKDVNVKLALSDLRSHFKQPKPWTINYTIIRDCYKLNDTLFNAVLELSGYKIKYSKERIALVIYK